MNNPVPAALGAALLALVAGGAQATDVGVSIGISQPGVYGRIDIGRFPQPQVIVQRPVVIVREAVRPQPIYLHVPPGHAKNWGKHCARYNACGQPVYFVKEPVRGPSYGGRPGYSGRDDRRDDRRWDDGQRGGGKHDRGDRGGRHDGRGDGRGKGNGNRD